MAAVSISGVARVDGVTADGKRYVDLEVGDTPLGSEGDTVAAADLGLVEVDEVHVIFTKFNDAADRGTSTVTLPAAMQATWRFIGK